MSMIKLVDTHARDSSSTMIAWVTWSAPVPPYSTGNPSAGSSIERHASKLSHEYSPVSSTSAARGAILSSQNWRITARNSRCSSVRVMGCTPPVSHRWAKMTPVLAESYKLDPGLPPWITAAMVLAWLVVVGAAGAIVLCRRAAGGELRRQRPVRPAEPDRPELPSAADVQNDPL